MGSDEVNQQGGIFMARQEKQVEECGCVNPNMCDCLRSGQSREEQIALQQLHAEDEFKEKERELLRARISNPAPYYAQFAPSH